MYVEVDCPTERKSRCAFIGRWEVGGYDLTSGEMLEVQLDLPGAGRGGWIAGRIEHDGRDYFLMIGERDIAVKLKPGLQARTR